MCIYVVIVFAVAYRSNGQGVSLFILYYIHVYVICYNTCLLTKFYITDIYTFRFQQFSGSVQRKGIQIMFKMRMKRQLCTYRLEVICSRIYRLEVICSCIYRYKKKPSNDAICYKTLHFVISSHVSASGFEFYHWIRLTCT